MELTYKVRLYSGISYDSTISTERALLVAATTSVTLADYNTVPSTRPLRVMVSVMRHFSIVYRALSESASRSQCRDKKQIYNHQYSH